MSDSVISGRARHAIRRWDAAITCARGAVAASGLLAGACVSFPPPPEATRIPELRAERVIAADGAALGLSSWRADDPRAVLVAVHGMNDYAGAFRLAGPALSEGHAVTVYAYDQRGFGRSPDFGRWPGAKAMTGDLRAAIEAVRAAHAGVPIFVLGHSMGAAVVLAAMAEGSLNADGAILAAPGVWGGAAMPAFYRAALNLSASVAPAKTLTGERAGRQASDNIEFLRAMFADPLIIKDTRLDAVLGAVRLMGRGYDASNEVGGRVLILYGARDEIIPVKLMRRLEDRLCGRIEVRAYPQGWHLLFADRQAETVFRDVGAWIEATLAERPAAGAAQLGPAAGACEAQGAMGRSRGARRAASDAR